MRRYRSITADSARWADFPFRTDDCIVATPAKCGTTWMQSLVSMLLTGELEPTVPLSVRSPWWDMNVEDTGELGPRLDAQQHRRFAKTHTPLDGFEWPEGVTVIVVVRHPLDAFLSWRDHLDNLDIDRFVERIVELHGADALATFPPPAMRLPDVAEDLEAWLAAEDVVTPTGMDALCDYAHWVATAWARRRDRDVHLFHYSDLLADTAGEIARLAAILGVDVDDERLRLLVAAADFGSMRSRAETFTPNTDKGLFKSSDAFFRAGGRRAWQGLLDGDEEARVRRRLDEELGAEAADWALHGGSAADGDTQPVSE